MKKNVALLVFFVFVFVLVFLLSTDSLASDSYTPMLQDGKIITIFSQDDGEKKPTVEELRKIKRSESKKKAADASDKVEPKDTPDSEEDAPDESSVDDGDNIDAEDEGE